MGWGGGKGRGSSSSAVFRGTLPTLCSTGSREWRSGACEGTLLSCRHATCTQSGRSRWRGSRRSRRRGRGNNKTHAINLTASVYDACSLVSLHLRSGLKLGGNGLLWHGMVWYGMAWHGIEWVGKRRVVVSHLALPHSPARPRNLSYASVPVPVSISVVSRLWLRL